MTISRDEAGEALREITQTQRRSGNVYGYQMASPYFILWGAIWMVGYAVSYLRPQWSALWFVLDVIGIAGGCYIAARSKPPGTLKGDGRFAATGLALFLFICALFAIMPPQNGTQVGAFFPILVALGYSLIGIWTGGLRILFAGAAMAVLTLVGYFYLPAYFPLWMSVVGGGGLILGGFWLRST